MKEKSSYEIRLEWNDPIQVATVVCSVQTGPVRELSGEETISRTPPRALWISSSTTATPCVFQVQEVMTVTLMSRRDGNLQFKPPFSGLPSSVAEKIEQLRGVDFVYRRSAIENNGVVYISFEDGA